MRELVLRIPLGLRFKAEEIAREKEEWIFASDIDGKIVSSCQFLIMDYTAKMRQVATAKEYQGQGLGRDLYLYCENSLKKQGVKEIYCHARKSAIRFYEKMNFEIVSEEFEEVGLPHVKMKKRLL